MYQVQMGSCRLKEICVVEGHVPLRSLCRWFRITPSSNAQGCRGGGGCLLRICQLVCSSGEPQTRKRAALGRGQVSGVDYCCHLASTSFLTDTDVLLPPCRENWRSLQSLAGRTGIFYKGIPGSPDDW